MPLLTLLQIISAAAGGLDALVKIKNDLQAKGATPETQLSPEHVAVVTAAVAKLQAITTEPSAANFGSGGRSF
jgi:hypothetical protein